MKSLTSTPLRYLLVLLFVVIASFVQAQTATVATDRLDYPPGDTAIITGTGFQPGETVTLQVLHIDMGVDSLGTDPQYHQPFTTVADSNGNIYATWWVPNDGDALGATWFGFTTHWVNRQSLPFEALSPKPHFSGSDLTSVLVSLG